MTVCLGLSLISSSAEDVCVWALRDEPPRWSVLLGPGYRRILPLFQPAAFRCDDVRGLGQQRLHLEVMSPGAKGQGFHARTGTASHIRDERYSERRSGRGRVPPRKRCTSIA